jgi:DNA-binding GntR family transcriptional regulator
VRIDYRVSSDIAPSWTRTVLRTGHAPRSKTVTIRLRRASKEVRETLLLPKRAEAVYFVRERYVDDELAAYAQTWLAADLVPDLAATLGSAGSLHCAFEDVYLLEPVRAALQAEIIVASDALARKLKLEHRPALFRLDGRTDSVRARRPVEVTSSWLRADVFRIVFALEPQPA